LHVTLELQDVADAAPEEGVTVDDHDPRLDPFVSPVAAATSFLRLRLSLGLGLLLWLGLRLGLVHVLLLGVTDARHDRVSASRPGGGAESASPLPVATRSAGMRPSAPRARARTAGQNCDSLPTRDA